MAEFTLTLKPVHPDCEPEERTITLCDDCIEPFDFGAVAEAMAKLAWVD
jgi:hypothetical protein